MFYERLIDFVYQEAGLHFSELAGREVDPANEKDVPREKLESYFKQFEIVSHVFTMKAIDALNAADFNVAGRIFEDAIRVIPDGVKYVEPFFYKALVEMASGWPEEKMEKTIELAFAHEPCLLDRFDYLFGRLSGLSDQATFRENFEKLLEKHKKLKQTNSFRRTN